MTVIGPLATPPESKAIAVKSFGAKKVSNKHDPYIGSKNHHILMPVKTRRREIPTAMDTPMHNRINIVFRDKTPLVSSLTCLVRAWTDGSARTMRAPKSAPRGTSIQRYSETAIMPPSNFPIGRNPTLTPVKKNTSPKYE